MRILALIAGTNEPSNADFLASAFLKGIKAASPKTVITTIHLHDLQIEHFDLSHYNPKTKQEKDFTLVAKAVQEADGVLIASPIWNFSVPAHLKNLIDRLGSIGLDAEFHSKGTLKGKPVFLLYTGGTPYAAWKGLIHRTVSHLPYSLRYFGCTIVGTYYEERATPGRGKFGLVVDKRPRSLRIVRAKGERFAAVAARYARDGGLPMREAMMRWAFQTGQTIKIKLGL